MQFLADVELICENAEVTRFKSSVLEVKYHNKNIHDVLEGPLARSLAFFLNVPGISKLRIPARDWAGYLRTRAIRDTCLAARRNDENCFTLARTGKSRCAVHPGRNRPIMSISAF